MNHRYYKYVNNKKKPQVDSRRTQSVEMMTDKRDNDCDKIVSNNNGRQR